MTKPQAESTEYEILLYLSMARETGFPTDLVAFTRGSPDYQRHTDAAIVRIVKRGWAYYPERGVLEITTLGEDVASDARQKPALEVERLHHAWRTEVLTGMDAYGHETKIENAVLPTCQRVDEVRHDGVPLALRKPVQTDE